MIMIFLWLKICGTLNENGLLPLKQTISHEKLMVGRLLSLSDSAISHNKLAVSVGIPTPLTCVFFWGGP